MTFPPPALCERGDLVAVLNRDGYAVIPAVDVGELAGIDMATLQPWCELWSDLPVDGYLRDGGHYRRRRHSCFTVHAQAVMQVAHRPHWQPLEYNALHGGMQRHFEPIAPAMVEAPAWQHLLGWLGQVCSALKGEQTWYAEAHQFRIDTTGGIGRPTPEGAHRDGVDLVAVFMVDRHAIKGGETRVFDAFGPSGQRFTLTQPWSVLLLDDARVVHESTPIQPLAPDAHRDTLVITLRAKAFQDISGA
jgi:hypothetical protein